jgi:hypothetical protein
MGKTTILKPALPKSLAASRGVEVRTKSLLPQNNAAANQIRSSPVYAGHAIKPLANL